MAKNLKDDMLTALGNLQLRAGHTSGCKIAIYLTVNLLNDDDTHNILPADAQNAFNSIKSGCP